MKTLVVRMVLGALCVVTTLAARASAEDKPSEIRIAYPGVGNGNRPYVGGNSASTMHLRGLLEEEFRKDGIKVTWTFLRGAGPAVNELYANGLADFSLLGDLPAIVGRASGLKTRMLAATGIRSNTYLAVPSDSPIQSLKDLKGKRVAIFKGTNIQLSIAKILEANGFTEKDIKAINMDTATARAALITGDIDAAFGDYGLLGLRDQGTARIVYTTLGDPRFLRHASWVGLESFINKYPAVTQRVVNTLVRAAKWISDNEQQPTVVFQLWAKSGYPFSNFKEDAKGQSLKVLSSPLIDTYLTSQYKRQIQDAKRFNLIKAPFDFNTWVDSRFINQAVKELGLDGFWEAIGEDGQPKRAPGTAAAPARTDGVTASAAQ